MTTDRAQLMQAAAQHLSRHDSKLAPIIERVGPCTITPHTDYYRELVDAIISQQLSVKASATIIKRFLTLFDGTFPSPPQILERDIEELRSVGMSRPKARYVLDLAAHIVEGKLKPDKLPMLTNEEAIHELVAVKGIGEWTAHMFLIFSLGRTDILATGDLGVRTAMKKLYKLSQAPQPDEMHTLAQQYRWHPYESIACWYLWQSLDNEPAL